MRKSILTAILIALLTVIGAAGNALAASASATNIIVSPGSRVCLTRQYGSYKVRAEGLANRGVRFTVHRSATGSTYQDIYQSPDNATAFAAEFNSTYHPYYFPGYFKVCARNLSTTTGATVSLSIKTDADAP